MGISRTYTITQLFVAYKPTTFFWRPQVTLKRHRELEQQQTLLSSLHFNIAKFPKETKYVKGFYAMAHMLDDLPNLTHLLMRGFELNQDPMYLKQYNIRQSVIDNLPLTITHLKLIINVFVDHLPSTVTHLSFGFTFNKPIDHLPSKLTHLFLGDEYSGHVDYLPHTLTHLRLGSDFNNPIDHLPSALMHLTLGFRFNKDVDNLPPSLRVLKFMV